MHLADAATAYTAGLIHDLGKFALAYANFTALDDITSRVPDEFPTWREAEKVVLGFESTQVTKALLENWGFPATFVSVGYFYQTPSECPDSEKAIVTLIHAAKHVATQLGYGVGVDGFYYEPDEQALCDIGFKDEEMDAAIPEILTTIQKYVSPAGDIRFT
jgi:HD-like signal output (HDOD) protein